MLQNTHFDRLPSIRYRWPLSISTHDFPHFLDSWIGRHQVVKGQLILVVNPADIATSSNLPEDQTECVHVGPLERVEVVHVYRLFKNLKAENVRHELLKSRLPDRVQTTAYYLFDIFLPFHNYYLSNYFAFLLANRKLSD